jgi:hypothetical protein
MRKSSNSTQKVEVLKSELTKVRQECLLATRQNDFRRMAQLTVQAAELNKALREAAVVE